MPNNHPMSPSCLHNPHHHHHHQKASLADQDRATMVSLSNPPATPTDSIYYAPHSPRHTAPHRYQCPPYSTVPPYNNHRVMGADHMDAVREDGSCDPEAVPPCAPAEEHDHVLHHVLIIHGQRYELVPFRIPLDNQPQLIVMNYSSNTSGPEVVTLPFPRASHRKSDEGHVPAPSQAPQPSRSLSPNRSEHMDSADALRSLVTVCCRTASFSEEYAECDRSRTVSIAQQMLTTNGPGHDENAAETHSSSSSTTAAAQDGSLMSPSESVHGPHVDPSRMVTEVKMVDEDSSPDDERHGYVTLPQPNTEPRSVGDISQQENGDRSVIRVPMDSGVVLWACVVCKRTFSHKHSAIQHCRNRGDQAGAKPHQCAVCDKVFSTRTLLKQHSIVHQGVERYRCACETCGKMFRNRSHLRDHIRIHTGERPFKCHICPRAFKQASDLRKHVALHLADAPYKCPQCGAGFRRSDALKRHVESHHMWVGHVTMVNEPNVPLVSAADRSSCSGSASMVSSPSAPFSRATSDGQGTRRGTAVTSTDM